MSNWNMWAKRRAKPIAGYVKFLLPNNRLARFRNLKKVSPVRNGLRVFTLCRIPTFLERHYAAFDTRLDRKACLYNMFEHTRVRQWYELLKNLKLTRQRRIYFRASTDLGFNERNKIVYELLPCACMTRISHYVRVVGINLFRTSWN